MKKLIAILLLLFIFSCDQKIENIECLTIQLRSGKVNVYHDVNIRYVKNDIGIILKIKCQEGHFSIWQQDIVKFDIK